MNSEVDTLRADLALMDELRVQEQARHADEMALLVAANRTMTEGSDLAEAEIERLRDKVHALETVAGLAAAEAERLRAEAATWGHMWDDVDLLTFRIESLRNGTAILGSKKAD